MEVFVCGALGRMGKLIVERVKEEKDMKLAGAVVKEENIPGFMSDTELEDALKGHKKAIVVDFTEPEATVKHAEIALSMGHNMVIGTTGLTEEEIEGIKNLAEIGKASVVLSPNFSLGINVLLKAVELISQKLEGYDADIIEIHHRNKRDKPSGTAIAISQRLIQKADIHSIRAGDIFGEHIVMFAGSGEKLEVKHTALGRDCFVSGVIRAIRWIHGLSDGEIHSMEEVLGL
jgi:4-hydroxy-tetrahydrodipicolinate reductase